jgi:hypothetical protein
MPSEGASILTAKRMAFSYFGENLTMSKNKRKALMRRCRLSYELTDEASYQSQHSQKVAPNKHAPRGMKTRHKPHTY